MKKGLQGYLRTVILSAVLLTLSVSSYATHIVGAELRYKWISGLTYQVSVYLYGDCGSTSGSFSLLPSSTPQVCIYNGSTLYTTILLGTPIPSTGTEVSPVCPDSLAYTQCTSLSYTIPGVKKFVCTGTVTLPSTSAVWRFIYDGNNVSNLSGRSVVISNIATLGGAAEIQLIDTLNNSVTNTRGHNSSPLLTVEPTPYFCGLTEDCYNPGAVDIDDVSPSQPAGDSLVFQLIPATNGTGTCGTVGGPATYISTVCPGGPTTSGSSPLSLVDCLPTSFSFDYTTGQLCFYPINQRSVVVYNIEEYRDDTVSPGVVNKVMVGTMQREMTFLVKTCTYTTPIGRIDSFAGAGDTINGHHYYSCANSGSFALYVNPTEPDTSLHISVTATGLSAGFTFSVVGNNTSSPHVTVTGNTSVITPGNYVFYLTFIDNHCPLVGSKTYAFAVDILPVPTIRDSLLTSATCSDKATIGYIPGGTGKPWNIKISHDPPLGVGDTIHTFMYDTTMVVDSLPPGRYYMTIFTSISNQCAVSDTFSVPTPHFDITGTTTDPTYCGAADGSIVLHDLNPGKFDTVRYIYNGVAQPPLPFYSTPVGTDTIINLLAGTYSNIIVQEGFCFTNPAGPLTLINPPFTWRTVTTRNASKKCFCDGIDTLFGLHPGQIDTITYTFTPVGSVTSVTSTISHYITADSMVIISGLCAGSYTSFIVNTAGVCTYTIPGPFVIAQPPITANYNYQIHYGCNGDTVVFTNLSAPASELTYRWFFGDGYTDTATNPKHVFRNTSNTTYNVKLIISNGICIDSNVQTITLDNFVHSGFSFAPDPFVCQDSVVTFTNSATGTNISYLWDFGDGVTDISPDPTHVFTNSGTYKVTLVTADHVLPTPAFFSPCYDTVVHSITVDSISGISILATDSVICRGQAITFTGAYYHVGDTMVSWGFGDGNNTVGVDPIQHSFDETGTFAVTINVKYRACPETTSSHSVRVYGYPDVYLGPDTSICPGGAPLILSDARRVPDPKEKWQWSNGETTSQITVSKPGYYSAVVTVDGCSSSDTIWVKKDCYMDVPNVFSPNGDGVNDYFYPRQLLTKGLISFKMNIFNRWGQEIYETTLIDGVGWDGKFNDKPQPAGVYVYMIEAKFKDGQVEHHEGNVTLLR